MENIVREYLKSKCVTVPNQWIPDCIEFIKSEYDQQYTRNVNWLKEKVFEQWLYSDLSELGVSSLPMNVSHEKSTIIKGNFILQMNEVKDVGFAAYSQLKKLTREDNLNANVSAERKFTAAWEPKQTRMLMLELTDGTCSVKAIEYRSVPVLSLALKPGVKVLLRGMMEVRRGVILLSSHHVTVLGGEVDTLLTNNASENVLRRALALEENERPIEVPSSFNPVDVVEDSQPSQYYNTQSTQRSQNVNFNNTPSIQRSQNVNFNHSMNNSKKITPFTPNISTMGPPPPVLDDLMDDFMDDEMEMALLAAEQNTAKVQKTLAQTSISSYSTVNSLKSSKPSTVNYNRGNYGSNINKMSNTFQNSQEPEDDDDDILLAAVEMETPQSSSFVSDFSTTPTQTKAISKPDVLPEPSFLNKSSFGFPKKLDNLQNSCSKLSQFSKPVTPKTASIKPFICSSSNSKNKIFSTEMSNNMNLTRNLEKPPGPSLNTNNGGSKTTTQAKINPVQSQSIQTPNATKTSFKVKLSMFKRDMSKPKESENMNKFPPVRLPSDSGQSSSSSSGFESFGNSVLLSSEHNTSNPSWKAKLQQPTPFQYICFMNKNPTVEVKYTIKAFVTTLLSKLAQSGGKWSVAAKVNDGTGSCDVDIDDQVLTKLIGMTTIEFNAQKDEARNNPVLKSTLAQSLSQCQREMIQMCCLMEVVVQPGTTRPRVMKLSATDVDVFLALKDRVSQI